MTTKVQTAWDGITDEMMRSWQWSDETIDHFKETRELLHGMSDAEVGFYEGVFDAFASANGEQVKGVSHHRLPSYGPFVDEGVWDAPFDYRKFLAIMEYVDDEGHIFTPGILVVRPAWAVEGGHDVREPEFFLHCTEAMESGLDPAEDWPDVAWGYAESLKAWEDFVREEAEKKNTEGR